MKIQRIQQVIIMLFLGLIISKPIHSQVGTFTTNPTPSPYECGLSQSVMATLANDTAFVNGFTRYNNEVNNNANKLLTPAPYIVPVVFHVISTTSVTSVLPYAQIQWQMARLNAAFANSMNLFTGQPNGPQAVNTHIEFRLACVAKNCNLGWSNNAEPGVMRYASSDPLVLNQGVAPNPATTIPMLAITHPTNCPSTFPTSEYLNIWCVPNIGSAAAYGTFPWLNVGIDGIVSRIDIIGNNSYPTGLGGLMPSLDKGSVLAHEAGYYLGLFHTFETVLSSNVNTAGGLLNCYGTTGTSALTDGDIVYDTPPTLIN